MVLREFLKENQDQLGHQDQRDLRDLLGLQGTDNQDLWDNLDLLVHQECLEWANQVCQDCQASQEEMVRLGHKEKWGQEGRKGHLDSKGLRVPQDHLGYQEWVNQGGRDYQANQGQKESQVTKVCQDYQDYQDPKEIKGWASQDNLVTKGSQGPRDQLAQEDCLVLENRG